MFVYIYIWDVIQIRWKVRQNGLFPVCTNNAKQQIKHRTTNKYIYIYIYVYITYFFFSGIYIYM